MKKILGLFFSLLVLLMTIPTVAAKTETKEYEKLRYQITDSGEAVIIDCDKSVSGEITLPETIDGFPVTVIGPQAFERCRDLVDITLPSTIKSIGFLAFLECNNLKNLTIPDVPVSIESNALSDTAYYGNDKNWKDGGLYVGNHLIKASKSAKGSFKIKDPTITIAGGAFKDSEGVKKITIPDSVQVIGNDAFNKTEFYKNKSNWKSYALYAGKHLIEVSDSAKGDIKIKENTLTIADSAFDFCKKINSVEIPDSVKKISTRAFRYCTSLKSISIPDSITEVSEFAFEGCSALKEVNYGGIITDFEEVKIYRGNSDFAYAKLNPKKLEYKKDDRGNLLNFLYEEENGAIKVTFCDPATVGTVTIPEKLEDKPVKIISEEAFKDCSIVNKVILPDTVETIEKSAFENCGITEITIPEKITLIEENVFSGCVALETVKISDTLRKINKNAFKGCTSLTDIQFKGEEALWNSVEIDESNITFKNTAVTFVKADFFGFDIHELILPFTVGGGLAIAVIITAIIITAVRRKKRA